MTPRPTTVTLSLRECEPGALPPVCAKCGAPATRETAVTFGWFPKPIFLVLLLSPLVFLLVVLIVRKVRAVSMPVCPEHAGVWNRGRAILVGTVITGFALLGLAVLLSEVDVPQLAALAVLLLFPVMLIGLAVGFWTLSGGVQARRIDEQEITPTGLHPDFVDAVENHSPARQAAYDARRVARKVV